MLAAKGQSSYGQDQDDVVLTPFYTAERKVLGSSQVSASVTSTTGNGSTNPVLNPYAGVLTNNAVYASDTSLDRSVHRQHAGEVGSRQQHLCKGGGGGSGGYGAGRRSRTCYIGDIGFSRTKTTIFRYAA